MLQLTLIRHAKSSWSNTGLSDFERPLNQRGFDNAPLMGRILKELGIQFDLIVSSPAQRAASTAELLATELGYPVDRISLNDSLYGADVNTLLEVVQALPKDMSRVAMVAHNPGLTDFLNYLCNTDIDNMPTCSAACIRLAVNDWSAVFRETGTLDKYEYPRRHTD
jgi:phosphohistidine phosphatase